MCALARSADNTAPRRAVAMAAVLLIVLLPRTERPAAGATAASCAARKIKATAFKTQRKLTCHAKAASKHEPVAPDCLAHAEDKFARTFDALELTGACSTNGNKGTIEHKVDQFVDDVVAELTGSPEGSLLTTPAARSCGARKLKTKGSREAQLSREGGAEERSGRRFLPDPGRRQLQPALGRSRGGRWMRHHE